HARLAVAGGDAAVVRLAGPEVADVLGLRLQPRGGVDVGQVVGEHHVERVPVFLAHGLETVLIGTKDVGLGPGRHDSLLWKSSAIRADRNTPAVPFVIQGRRGLVYAPGRGSRGTGSRGD